MSWEPGKSCLICCCFSHSAALFLLLGILKHRWTELKMWYMQFCWFDREIVTAIHGFLGRCHSLCALTQFHYSNLMYDVAIWRLSQLNQRRHWIILPINFRTTHCSFRFGPIMIVDEPFTVSFHSYLYSRSYLSCKLDIIFCSDWQCTVDTHHETKTDKVTAKYQTEIKSLFKWDMEDSCVWVQTATATWNWEDIERTMRPSA
jgi:hypothetical protein